eukprot:237022-Prymnesium_polylepis.1
MEDQQGVLPAICSHPAASSCCSSATRPLRGHFEIGKDGVRKLDFECETLPRGESALLPTGPFSDNHYSAELLRKRYTHHSLAHSGCKSEREMEGRPDVTVGVSAKEHGVKHCT